MIGKGLNPPILSYLVKKVEIDLKIGKFRVSKKAVSPVIATLLMIAVAVAASVIVYVWSAGLLGTLMGGGGSQVKEQLIMEAYDWTASGTLTLYLRNVGSASSNVTAVYVGGNPGTLTPISLNPGDAQSLDVTGVSGSSGVAYTVKVVTRSGAVFSFSCINGKAE